MQKGHAFAQPRNNKTRTEAGFFFNGRIIPSLNLILGKNGNYCKLVISSSCGKYVPPHFLPDSILLARIRRMVSMYNAMCVRVALATTF